MRTDRHTDRLVEAKSRFSKSCERAQQETVQIVQAVPLNIPNHKGKLHPCTGTEALYRPYAP